MQLQSVGQGQSRKFTAGTRRWILDEICDWYNGAKSAVFLLVGDGGVGKSVIMAELCRHGGALMTINDKFDKGIEKVQDGIAEQGQISLWKERLQVAAYHFFRHDQVNMAASPKEALVSIAWQLCQSVPGFADELDGVNLEGLREKTLADVFQAILVDPAGKLSLSQRRQLVVLDALDECKDSDELLRKVIRVWKDDMPTWLSLVVSTRPEGEIQRGIKNNSLDSKVLELKDDKNFGDIKFHIEHLLANMSEVVEQKDVVSCAEILSKRSEGLFLWASFLPDTLRRAHEEKKDGLLTMQDISKKDSIPNGLGGMFEEYFERLRDKMGGDEAYQTLLTPIVAAREPLSEGQLSAILGQNKKRTKKIIGDARNLLYQGGDGRVALIHKRMADWLLDDDVSGDLGVDIDEGHKRLAAYCSSSRDNIFSLRHAVFHSVKSGDSAKAFELLNDFVWVKKAISIGDDEAQRRGTIGDLIRDCVDLGINFAPQSDTPRFLSKAVHALSYDPNELASQVLARLGHAAKDPLVLGLQPPHGCPWLEPVRVTLPHPRDPLLHVLQGHSYSVNCVAIQDDIIVSGSADNTMRIWSATSGEAQHVLSGHSSRVRTVAMQGDIIVSGSRDKTVRVWSVTSGATRHILEGHADQVTSVTIEGDIIVSASSDETVRTWHATSGEALHVLKGHSGTVWSVTMQGDIIVSGSADKTLRTWNVTTGEEQLTIEGHTGWVRSVAIQGNIIVSGSADLTVRTWNAISGEAQHVLTGHLDWVRTVAIQGDTIVSGSRDKTLRVWSTVSGEVQHVLKGHSNWIRSVVMQGDIIVSASRDKTVRIWSVTSGEAQHLLEGHADQVMSVAIHGDIVVSASLDRTVRTWKATSGELGHVLEGHSGMVMSVAIEGDTLVSGSADKTARVWNATSGKLQHILEGHSGWVMSVAIHGDAIVSGSADNTVCIWNALSGEAQHVLKGHSSRVRTVAIQGDVIVSQSVDSTRYWKLQSGEEIDANVAPAIDASESLVDVQDGTHVKLDGGVGFTIDHAFSATAHRLGKVVVVGDRGGMVHILHAQGVKSAMTQA